MRSFYALFSDEERDLIVSAPLFLGWRHPTWFPLFHPEAIDQRVGDAASWISGIDGGGDWLLAAKPALLDMADPRNASAKLAEIRVFGGLLEAGAQVVPVPCTDDSTPDFIVDFGDGEVAVEVFSKHQDEVEDAQQEAIHGRGPLPEGVERTELNAGNSTVTMTVSMLTPGGKPDALKPGDSVQANLISRICAAKGKELQFSAGKPNLLVLDFCHFGGRVLASMVDAVQAEPVESGHHGLSSGAFWYAMYGWKGAPIFEELSHKLVRMGHAGRFRLTGTRKTKLSAVLMFFRM